VQSNTKILISLIEQHSAVSPGTNLSLPRRSAADSMYLPWKYASGGADCPAPDTSHLFSVLPFPSLPILRNVAFLTSIYNRSCLQRASVLQAGIIFYIFRNKRAPLGSAIKHTFTTTKNMKLLHILRTSIINCLLWHYSPSVYYSLQCWFSIGKITGFAGNV